MAYVEPTPADLKHRDAAFSNVSDDDIAYWLTDAHRYVDQSWFEQDYGPALIAHAAYEMSTRKVNGFSGGDVAGFAAAGVSEFKSGQFQARFSDKAIEVASRGGYEANDYGREYLDLLRRNKGGLGVTSAGALPCYDYGYNGYAGPLPFGGL
jgi:hypothetical protein